MNGITLERSDPNQESLSELPKTNTIVEERNETDDFNLENSPSSTTTLPKGKSKGLPVEVESFYALLDEHFQKRPSIFRPDGIRKKQKTHFLNWLKKLFEKKLVRIPNFERTKFKKLNQNTLSNINLSFNSSLLNKPVYKVYNDDDSLQNKQLMEALYNTYNIPDRDNLMLFLETPLWEVYYMYLESSEFESDLIEIENKTVRKHLNEASLRDKPYILRYREIYEIFSREFVKYYMGTAPNKKGTSPTYRRPNRHYRDNWDNQDLNSTVEVVDTNSDYRDIWDNQDLNATVEAVDISEAFEIDMTESEQGSFVSTNEETYFMCESDIGSEFY
jgi:hypothetical protein